MRALSNDLSIPLHHTLKRMLVLACEIHHERNFGFGDLISKDAAFTDAILMNMHHDPVGIVLRFVEKMLQHMHHEFHGREVVIQQQNAIEIRLFGLRLGAGNHGDAGIARAAPATWRQGHRLKSPLPDRKPTGNASHKIQSQAHNRLVAQSSNQPIHKPLVE